MICMILSTQVALLLKLVYSLDWSSGNLSAMECWCFAAVIARCLSVRLSVTVMYCVKTVEPITNLLDRSQSTVQ